MIPQVSTTDRSGYVRKPLRPSKLFRPCPIIEKTVTAPWDTHNGVYLAAFIARCKLNGWPRKAIAQRVRAYRATHVASVPPRTQLPAEGPKEPIAKERPFFVPHGQV